MYDTHSTILDDAEVSSLERKTVAKSDVLSLTSLVEYAEGSVVSRTVLDKPAGTVTLFSFDEEQGLSEHTAPYDAIVMVVEGKAQVTISGKPLVVSQGEMVIMPADEPHALRALEQFKMLLIMIRS